MRFVRYFEQPGYEYSRLEFGLMDPKFAMKVISEIPDSWHKSSTMTNPRTGRLFIKLKHHHGLFWDLVKIIEGLEDHGLVSMESREFQTSNDRIFYKTLT